MSINSGKGHLAAHDYITHHFQTMTKDEKKFLKEDALKGWELVHNTARLCAMNMMLHGIGTNGGKLPLTVADSLASDPGDRFDMVLTNPPFGKKSSTTIIGSDGKPYSDCLDTAIFPVSVPLSNVCHGFASRGQSRFYDAAPLWPFRTGADSLRRKIRDSPQARLEL